MNRAMFSGVAGMKAHQSKMDVIGNNIANVNTYGFKSQRAVFSDIFYQTIRNASEGTLNRGGTNPSTIGYGSNLVGVQTQMTQSSMQNTGFGMDVAIMGEGFLQVMDPDGNIFYTKAGLLDYDSNGYLTDINGNFVLGAAGAGSAPGTQKIKLDNIGSVDPKRASVDKTINGINYNITASNSSAAGNIGLTIGASESLPAGQKALATISNTGAISVQLNGYEQFSSMTELNDVINQAITEANGGKQHAGGVFTITSNVDPFGKQASPGDFLGGVQANFLGGAKITGVSGTFPGTGTPTFSVANVAADGAYSLSAAVGGVTYSGNVTAAGGPVTLTNANGESITMEMPSFDAVKAQLGIADGATVQAITTVLNGSVGAHNYSLQAYAPAQVIPLTGSEISGSNFGVKTGSITGWETGAFGGMTFKNTSTSFQGSGTVNPTDFNAVFGDDASGNPAWKVNMTIGGVLYTGDISSKTQSASILLKGPNGDTIEVTNPGFDAMSNFYKKQNNATTDPVAGDTMQAFGGATKPLVVTPSTKSKDLGLGSESSYALSGGTEGGAITLDELASIAIGSDGTVFVSHAEKGTVVAGRISLASFGNPQGLQQAGSNYYQATVSSGQAVLTDPGTGGTGGLKSSALEMSNVDLSSEFSDMITTQRGFQANSRVITVSDTMLEELINLKR